MKGIPARTQGLVASGLTAILVLSVFANSTFTGPESTIEELHYGILTGEPDTVKDTVLQDPTTAPARQLLGSIGQLLAAGAQYEVRGVQSKGRDAVVQVVYSSPQFGLIGIEFFLHKSRDRWLVDADRTLGGLAARAPIQPG